MSEVAEQSPKPTGPWPSAEQFLDLVRHRRTSRVAGSAAVGDRELQLLLDAVRWSPSAANRQPWELIVIRDEAIKTQLRVEFLKEAAERDSRYRVVTERQADLLLAPVVIAVCGDEHTKELFVNAGELGDTVKEELFLLTMGAAIQTLLLMATACGLTSTWIARAARIPRIRDVLAVPDGVRVVALVAIGAGGPAPRSDESFRRPINSKTHADRFRSD